MRRGHELTDEQWERVATALGEPGLAGDLDEFQLDSTSVKAHPNAATGRREPGEKNDADHRRGVGRSRGGLTPKLHAAVDPHGRLRRLVVRPGQRGDAPQAQTLLGGIHPPHAIADAAYDSDAIRDAIAASGGRACIRPNLTRKRKKRHDRRRYKHRNVIERFFRRIKCCRRVATRYEKKLRNYAAFVWLAAGVVGCT